jgi:glutamine amidotransferase
MGNLRSVAKAVEAAGGAVRIVTRPDEVASAAGLVLPGVGALADCITALKAGGMDQAVREWIRADRPFLGVCLGLQALFDFSEEADTKGLGIFPGRVVRFKVPAGLKIPHMGWNTVRFTQPGSPLTAGLAPEGEAFYFVHSYHCMPADPSLVLAECEYGGPFTAAIARGRCFATQFHPEKSQAKGLQLYRNFVAVAAKA